MDTGWGCVHNEHLELNQGFERDAGTSAYAQLRNAYHSKGTALGRVSALFFSIDCTPNCMESRKMLKYRDKNHEFRNRPSKATSPARATSSSSMRSRW